MKYGIAGFLILGAITLVYAPFPGNPIASVPVARANTAPTFVQESEIANGTGARSTTFSVQANDVLVAYAMMEDGIQTMSISTTSGTLSWTLQQDAEDANNRGGSGETWIWTAISASAQSVTVKLTPSNTSKNYVADILTFRGSDGVGASNGVAISSGASAPSLSLTTTSDNSAIVVADMDWNAASGSGRVWRTVNSITPTAANGLETTYVYDSANLTAYGAYYTDAGTAGAKTVGMSSPSQLYAIAAVEVKGAAAAATVSISGSCKAYDRSTNCTDLGTVSVAVNGVLQAQTDTGGGSGGTWSIAGVTQPSSGDVITVFISGAADADEATAVTKYDGSGDITGMALYKEHVTIGSADNQTISNTDLGQYDADNSADIQFTSNSGTFTADPNSHSAQEVLYVLSGNTYTPGGDVNVLNLYNAGTFSPESNLVVASGTGTAFVNTGTFNSSTSTVRFTGDGATVSLMTYWNLELKPGGSSQQVLGTSAGQTLQVLGNLTVGDGTHTGATAAVNNPFLDLRGDVTFAANAVYSKSSSTTTLKQGATQTWTDNASGQDLGDVTIAVNGTNTTVSLSGTPAATTLTIDASQALTENSATLILTGTGTPLTNNGTINYNTGTIRYTGNGATITNLSGTAGTNGYYNLELEPSSSSAQVLGVGTLVINNNFVVGDGTNAGATAATNNPTITVSGATTVNAGATFTSTSGDLTLNGDLTVDGTFSHNSGTVVVTPTASSLQITGTSDKVFNNFTSTTAGKNLLFKDGVSVEFAGTLSLVGSGGSPIGLLSTNAGSQWTFNLAGTASITNVRVQDSACAVGSGTVAASSSIVNLGNNGACWSFTQTPGIGSGPTDGGSGGGTPATGGTGNSSDSTDGGSGGGSAQNGENPALVRTASGGNGGAQSSFTMTLAQAPTAGNALIAVIGINTDTASVSSISGGGVTWNLAKRNSNATQSAGTEIWYGTNSSGSGTAITVTMSTAVQVQGGVGEFTNIAASDTVDSTAGNNGTSTAPDSGSVSTANANDLIIAATINQGAPAASSGPTNSFSTLVTTNTNMSLASGYRAVNSTGSYSSGWGLGGSNGWVGAIAAFKSTNATVSGGGGGATP